MQFSMKSLAAIGALAALASTPALAVDTPSSGNGSVFITVWDPTLGASIVQDLGLNYADFVTSQGVNPAIVSTLNGAGLSFNVNLSHFTSVGSNFADLRYTVFAADAVGNYQATGAIATAPINATITGQSGDVVNMIGSTGASQVAASWNLNCGVDAVICTGTGFGSTYFGGGAWGSRFGGGFELDGSTGLGEALGFYLLTRSGIGASSPMNSVQFAGAGGVAQWLLAANGSLSFTAPVPLPAAVWMLLSGLAGLGVVSRRKNGQA